MTTTLTGKVRGHRGHLRGRQRELAHGDLNLGGTNGQHDCTSGRPVAPATPLPHGPPSTRSTGSRSWPAGYLPDNTWLQNRLTTNVNLIQTCNAFWNGTASTSSAPEEAAGTRARSPGSSTTSGATASTTTTPNGSLSNPSEAYADIAAILRLQTSCVGHGFCVDRQPGLRHDRGRHRVQRRTSQVGAAHCDLDCSGVREHGLEQARGPHPRHGPRLRLQLSAGRTAAPAAGRCTARPRPRPGGLGPGGARPAGGALSTTTARPPSSSPTRSSTRAAATSARGTPARAAASSNGCGATNGYMQWLAADDDNGNLNDGTPHMTAHLRRVQPPRHRLHHARAPEQRLRGRAHGRPRR